MQVNGNRLLQQLDADFVANKASIYANAVKEKCKDLTNCIGFIDGTVIKIARPKGHKRQKWVL